MTFEEFVLFAREKNASDIHLTVGSPTVFRINGDLVKYSAVKGEPDFTPTAVNKAIHSMLTADQEQLVGEGADLDFTFELSDGSRQRVNIFHQSGHLAATIRLLNSRVPEMEELALPYVVRSFAEKRRGLVLVTGPTGSGKTTTLASMIDYINKNRPCHVITIEDPIEYKYSDSRATIHQREIGRDVSDFNTALRSALREDPDVILVGEMRDYETISLAITAAETGHLVFGTLHTTGAAETINRIIDAFPAHGQAQVRSQLSAILEGVISQTLIPMTNKRGMVAAVEVLVRNDAIHNLIRTDKTHQIDSVMQQGQKFGMCTLNDSIYRFYRENKISRDDALSFSNDKESLRKMFVGG